MNNNRGIAETVASLIVASILIITFKSCFTPIKDDGEPYETISTDENLDDDIYIDEEERIEYNQDLVEVTFAPGEHIVVVGIDDPIGGPIVYPGHPGYKPVGVSASTYGKYHNIYYAGYMIYENIVDVRTTATSVDFDGNYIYNNFGTPVDYEITSYGENAYDAYQHIIAVPCNITGPRTQIESVEGYEAVGIATASYGRYIGASAGTAILYVNTVPVKDCVDEYDIPTFGKPIEKQKVFEK